MSAPPPLVRLISARSTAEAWSQPSRTLELTPPTTLSSKPPQLVLRIEIELFGQLSERERLAGRSSSITHLPSRSRPVAAQQKPASGRQHYRGWRMRMGEQVYWCAV